MYKVQARVMDKMLQGNNELLALYQCDPDFNKFITQITNEGMNDSDLIQMVAKLITR